MYIHIYVDMYTFSIIYLHIYCEFKELASVTVGTDIYRAVLPRRLEIQVVVDIVVLILKDGSSGRMSVL